LPPGIAHRLEGVAAPSARSLNTFYGQLAEQDGTESADTDDDALSSVEVEEELIAALATGL
jgi:hypothetical protein